MMPHFAGRDPLGKESKMEIPRAVPKAIRELFDSQVRESERLVAALKTHEATFPSIMKEYTQIDGECITLAAQLSAARLAGSPTALNLEIKLKCRRWDRDRGKHNFRIERTRLHAELDSLTGPVIRSFHDEALAAAKNLLKLYKFERLEKRFNPTSERHMYTITVKHNSAQLERAQAMIFTRISEVRNMQYSTLSALEEKITQCRRDFENIETDTLETAEVGEQTADSMRPRPAEADRFDMAYPLGDGSLVLSGGRISSAGRGRS
jgi:hypothetical protein